MNLNLKERIMVLVSSILKNPITTLLLVLSIHNDKPYHLPDTERTTDELRKAYDAVINNSRVVIWDHFGSNTVDAVLDKIRHMHALGCKYIVLDHLSIVVSDQSGDERKQLDEIATKAKTLCMNLNIALIVVIHQNRQGQIRGTAGVEQLANIVIKLYREHTDKNEWRRNVTKSWLKRIGSVGALVLLAGCGTTASPADSKNSHRAGRRVRSWWTVSPTISTPSDQQLIDEAQASLDAVMLSNWLSDKDHGMSCWIHPDDAIGDKRILIILKLWSQPMLSPVESEEVTLIS
jgi:hypothetical protein